MPCHAMTATAFLVNDVENGCLVTPVAGSYTDRQAERQHLLVRAAFELFGEDGRSPEPTPSPVRMPARRRARPSGRFDIAALRAPIKSATTKSLIRPAAELSSPRRGRILFWLNAVRQFRNNFASRFSTTVGPGPRGCGPLIWTAPRCTRERWPNWPISGGNLGADLDLVVDAAVGVLMPDGNGR